MLLAFVILLALVSGTMLTYTMVWDDYGLETLLGRILATILLWPTAVGIIGFIAGLIFVALPANVFDGDREPYGSWELEAINMGEEIQGRFFLGSGYVNGEATYTYYYHSDGGLRVGEVNADEVLVVQTDEGNPRIEQTAERVPFWIDFTRSEQDYQTTIYVPEGSIAPVIDMELPE